MIRVIDKNDKFVVQKVINRKGGTVCYQAIQHCDVGQSDKVIRTKTLIEARTVAGIGYAATAAAS